MAHLPWIGATIQWVSFLKNTLERPGMQSRWSRRCVWKRGAPNEAQALVMQEKSQSECRCHQRSVSRTLGRNHHPARDCNSPSVHRLCQREWHFRIRHQGRVAIPIATAVTIEKRLYIDPPRPSCPWLRSRLKSLLKGLVSPLGCPPAHGRWPVVGPSWLSDRQLDATAPIRVQSQRSED